MSQFFRSITSASRQATRVVRPAPSNVRYISVTHARFSAAGYGDDPTEGASNSGTKTPASSPNPSKGKNGKQSGSTDPEVTPKKSSGGKKSGGAPSKQPGGKKVTHSEGESEPGRSQRIVSGHIPDARSPFALTSVDVDPTVKNALGAESGGKDIDGDFKSERKPGETVADKETKLPGQPPKKTE